MHTFALWTRNSPNTYAAAGNENWHARLTRLGKPVEHLCARNSPQNLDQSHSHHLIVCAWNTFCVEHTFLNILENWINHPFFFCTGRRLRLTVTGQRKKCSYISRVLARKYQRFTRSCAYASASIQTDTFHASFMPLTIRSSFANVECEFKYDVRKFDAKFARPCDAKWAT